MKELKQYELWLEEAVAEIRKSPGLRYFFCTMFEDAGLLNSAPVQPDQHARFEGQRDVVISIKNILDQRDPLLFSEMQFERANFLANADPEDGDYDGA